MERALTILKSGIREAYEEKYGDDEDDDDDDDDLDIDEMDDHDLGSEEDYE